MREAGETSPSETLAYLTEVTINSKGMRTKETRGFFRKLIDLFNKFLKKLGINRTMTKISDIVGAVEGYTRAAVELNAKPSANPELSPIFTSDKSDPHEEITATFTRETQKRFDKMKPGDGGLPTAEEMNESLEYAFGANKLDPKSLTDSDLAKLIKAYLDIQVFDYYEEHGGMFEDAITEYSKDFTGIANISQAIEKATTASDRVAELIRKHYQWRYPLPPGVSKDCPAVDLAAKVKLESKEMLATPFIGILHDSRYQGMADSACLAHTAYRLRGINIDIEGIYFTNSDQLAAPGRRGASGYSEIHPLKPSLSKPQPQKYVPVIYFASEGRVVSNMIHEIYHARDRVSNDKNKFWSDRFKPLGGVHAEVTYRPAKVFTGFLPKGSLYIATSFDYNKAGETGFSRAMCELAELDVLNQSSDALRDSVEYITGALAYPLQYCRTIDVGSFKGRYDRYLSLAQSNPITATLLINRDSRIQKDYDEQVRLELSAQFAGLYLWDAIFRNNIDRAVAKHPELQSIKDFIDNYVLGNSHHTLIEESNELLGRAKIKADYISPDISAVGEEHDVRKEKPRNEEEPRERNHKQPRNGRSRVARINGLDGRPDVSGRRQTQTRGGTSEYGRVPGRRGEPQLKEIHRSVKAKPRPKAEEVFREVKAHGITYDIVADVFGPKVADYLEDFARFFRENVAFKVWTQTYQLAMDAAKVGITNAKGLWECMSELQSMKQTLQRDVKKIESDFLKLSKDSRERVNRFLEESTISCK